MHVTFGSIRSAARQLRMSRGFTTAAVLTLALGIGGTTAIVTLIDAVMLQPLPVSDPARLYRIGDGAHGNAEGRPPGQWGMVTFPLYERLRTETPEFEDITAFDWGGTQFSVSRSRAADARPVRSEYVTGTYFATLGVRAVVGRVFSRDDDRPSAPPVVVLSHHAWRQAYGADTSVVGSTFLVEGHPFTVIGVAAPGFFGETRRGDPPDIWIPLQQEPVIAGAGSLLHQSVSPWLFVIGRLRPDASIAGMASRLTGLLRQWIAQDAGYPSNWMPDIVRDLPRQTIAVVPAGAGIGLEGLSAKERYGPSLQILLAICGFMLVMACANVANLLLVRAVARRAQTAMRVALGATRGQIIAEALTESVLLAAGGALAGLLVAFGAARLLLALAFRSSQFVPITATPSPTVLAFAVGLALVTGVVFGAAPAWCATRTDPLDALRGAGRSLGDHSSRPRAVLVAIQATLCVALVASSTMLARSLQNLEHQDFGFGLQGRMVIGLNRLPSTYTPQRLSALYRVIEQQLARLPGVRSVDLALYNPLASNWAHATLVAGHPQLPSGESASSWNRVSADYLRHLGVAIVRGREFTRADDETTAPVAVVNEAFVKRFFRTDEDPLDQHFGLERPENAGTFRIVGIVRDATFVRSGLKTPARPMFFVPLAQPVDYRNDQLRLIERLSRFIQGILLVTDVPIGQLEPRLRRTLADADPNLTITSVRTMQQQVDVSLDRERAVASLAELFSLIALALAGVGVYGVTAYMVARQTNEIGIRMALGADRGAVVQLVLRRTLRHVAAGLVAGLPLAVGAARLMSAQLYGVSFWDPVALSVAAGSLAGCALTATVIPALRAAAMSPVSALHNE
ncbi:MAG TPA: ABC transporter permease [Vicinamibacterales bacterium]